LAFCLGLCWSAGLGANVAGGGTGTGANVTVTQAGTNVTLANGIVSFTVNTTNGNVTAFTFNGTNYLSGGDGGGGGYFYIDNSGGPTLAAPTYTLTVNPANNGGAQAEIMLQTIASPMDTALYYDLLRGQQGIYDTLILTHESSYPDYPGAELRTNMYVGSIFDFICINPYRFRQMASTQDTYNTPGGFDSPAEVFLFTDGIYDGTTGSKYSYSAPLGQTNAYGWASTTTNYGVWQTFPSHEYLDAGPMHRELTAHLGNTLLDMFGGGHFGFGLTQDQPAGTVVSKTFGPAFIYANQYTGTSTNVTVYAQTLYDDAQAQAAAEQAAWPYTWFNPQPVTTGPGTTLPAYIPATGRGAVAGTFAIKDPDNPSASPAGMWIGLAPDDGGVDFQQQYLTYQFWVQTGAGGVFSISNVQPGTYNLWAFGSGAAGTFEQANVTVGAGQSLNLGTVTWTPPRLGPTVWQIGIPDRDGDEFNNGDHDVTPWSGVLPPYAGGAPYNTQNLWSAFMAYPTQYPKGVSYTVGVSNYANDWNYCQPTVSNTAGAFVAAAASKIFFNLAAAPAAGNQARLYIAFASQFDSACILTINGAVQTGTVVASTDGVNAANIATSATGFYVPNNSFDCLERLGSQGAWGDAYYDFPATLLKAGMNEIDIGMRPTGTASISSGFEYDYIRLECQGFVASPTPTPQVVGSATASATASATRTASPSATDTPSPSPTSTFTHSSTASPSDTATSSVTSSATRTASPSETVTQSATPTRSATVSASPSESGTPSVSSSPTSSSSPSLSATDSPTTSVTVSASPTDSSSVTASPTWTLSESVSPTQTPGVSQSVSETQSGTPSASPTRTTTATPSFSPTAPSTATDSPTYSLTPTYTSSDTPTLSATVSATRSPGASTGTPTATPRASATATAPAPAGTSTPLGGVLAISKAVPVPNPNPVSVAVDLDSAVDGVKGTLFSAAEVTIETFNWGPQAEGWNRLPLPADLSSLPAGVYYLRLQAVRGAAVSAPVVVKLFLTR
jgi:rhamnogalacturonan endolyase